MYCTCPNYTIKQNITHRLKYFIQRILDLLCTPSTFSKYTYTFYKIKKIFDLSCCLVHTKLKMCMCIRRRKQHTPNQQSDLARQDERHLLKRNGRMCAQNHLEADPDH